MLENAILDARICEDFAEIWQNLTPRPEDLLAPLPCPAVLARAGAEEPQSYKAWKARAYGNYYKSKQKKKIDRQKNPSVAEAEQA